MVCRLSSFDLAQQHKYLCDRMLFEVEDLPPLESPVAQDHDGLEPEPYQLGIKTTKH